MLSRSRTGVARPFRKVFFQWDRPKTAFFVPRFWMVLLLLALPFFGISATYLEYLERTGPISAFIADTAFSAMLVGYLVLVFVLKRRRI